ncbi:L-rhamnose mutarotase [Paenibacillus sp. CF384]|uniref:L-rhamnose mutarotase n=1 Tax=Paenibacillus sp. CF384 TaxID=1884382 RepID=UPI00089A02F4|nr:L-rhamnose mutarotase [Paenibacillus sp. CF384]SDW49012.1 L-rhamnose mutarotase [Paenibacillus sp. CF384]
MQRVSFVLQIDERNREAYIERHRNVDPELLKAFGEVGIRTYSIFIDGGKLFAYMEVEDFEQAMQTLSTHPANVRWQQFMADLLVKHEDGNIVREIAEVFHYSGDEG